MMNVKSTVKGTKLIIEVVGYTIQNLALNELC